MADVHQQQRYRVIEKLASGGMAEVFRAESAGLEGFKKQVAIKRVLPHLSEKKKFISMFLDEARLSAHLSHSNVVQVFDIGVGDNAFFIVMEYVDGADLKAVIETLKKQGREFPIEEAVFITIKLCEGLSYAHELTDIDGKPFAIVHRDMSPPNVLITKHGEIKIVDFGLAKASSQLEKSEPGIIKGKFSYLSPEAAFGQEVDHRTDIFAAGIILWEMLAGRRLFLGDSDFATVKQVQQAVIPSLSKLNPKVPADLEAILGRALAREPAQRYQTARELAVSLNQWLYHHGKPVGSFSIATLVQSAMKDRQKSKPQQGSIIDKLIEEALFEFTSLQEDAAAQAALDHKPVPKQGPSGASPLSLGSFNDVQDWANEIAVGHTPGTEPLVDALAPNVFEEGNLAALEEDEEPMLPPGAPMPSSMPPPPSDAPPAALSARKSEPRASETAPSSKKSGGGGATAAVVVVVLLVAAAGAYYAGMLPIAPGR